MAFRLTPLTTFVAAAPAETVYGRVEIHNDGTIDTTYAIAVVGLDSGLPGEPGPRASVRVSVAAGASATVEVPITVPANLGVGEHAAAFEATSNRSNDRAVLSPFTLSIASVERVELTAVPSTIRAHRRATFHLDVTNREPQPVEVTLTGEAQDVAVSFAPSSATLLPGQRIIARGKVKGPRHWSGESTQHNLVITARGRASSSTITTPFVQRPVFAHRFRMVLAGLTVVALWLAAIGGVAFWLSTRDEGSNASAAQLTGVDEDGDGIPDAFVDADGNPVKAVDTDGDGIPDAFYDAENKLIPGTDTDGDGIPDTLVDGNGRPLVAVDTDGDGIPDTLATSSFDPEDDEVAAAAEPNATTLRGTVTIDGDPQAVAITLTPIALGDAPDESAEPIGMRMPSSEASGGKIWPVRHGVAPGISSTVRRTVSVSPPTSASADTNGVFLFSDVLQGQSYELSFALAGYDTQAFVVTPNANGDPIDLDVEMRPANGSLSGSVTGPSGSKAAKINISDGTLEFQTTADSDTGAWSIEGVSTPGVYTMTAELRGYATAVRQVELAPGDDVSDIDLVMVPGMGTITGRVVDTSGEPLGGVTMTATSGGTTLTSTSLTDGDVGFFSLPQIAVPATYTVSASLDGYATESRRVPMSGSVGGVDFVMVSETATLTGRVTDKAGKGIANVGLVISTGDLTFRSSTSAAPSPGRFSIDRLPPGTYTITFEHFEYETETELVTLVAGVPPTPLDVQLERAAARPPMGTGSLKVTVRDDDPNADPLFIDASVTIKRTRTGDRALTGRTNGTSGFTFDDLPIGTYTIVATAPGYNRSQTQTRTIGVGGETIEIEMQKLGDASGVVVDAFSGPPNETLVGYRLRIWRLDGGFNRIEDFGVVEPEGADDKWSTDPNKKLPTGVYEIEVVDGPAGYYIPPNQVIDTSPAVRGEPMTFEVPAVQDAAVETIDLTIQARPYQQVTGRVYEPRLQGTAVAWLQTPGTDFDVTATCNAQTVAATKIAGGFTIDRIAVGEALAGRPSASCTLNLSAAGHRPSTITLDSVGVASSASATNRVAAFPLVAQPQPFNGRVSWLDAGTSSTRPLSGVTVSASVIRSFSAVEATAATPDPRPRTDPRATITATSAANGTWTLPGQLFGTAQYTFSRANFGQGTVQSPISEAGRSIGDTNNATVTGNATAGYQVTLTDAADGSLSGTVTHRTTRSPAPAATDMVRITRPGGGSPDTATPGAGGAYTFAGLAPGTWDVTFTPPANHRLDAPAGGTIAGIVVDPGEAQGGIDATITELGTINVSFVDKLAPGTALDPANVTFTLERGGSTVTLPPATETGTGTYRLRGIPVDPTDPVNVPRDYVLKMTVTGYNLGGATVNGAPIAREPVTGTPYIDTSLLAGQDRSYTVAIAPLRAFRGHLQGNVESGGIEDLAFGAAAAQVTVTPLAADGVTPITPLPGDEPVVAYGDDGEFSVTAPPGLYRIVPSHPQFQAITAAGYPTDPGNPGLPTGVFEILDTADTTPAGSFSLDLRPATLDLSAVTQLSNPTAVDAVYRLIEGDDCSPATLPAPVTLPAAGVEVQRTPGPYCLLINQYGPDGTTDIAFPAIVKVVLPRDTAATPSVTDVIAPLPPLAPSIDGTLVALNEDGDPVELAATNPTIEATFTSDVEISVNDTLVPNSTPNSLGDSTAVATAPAAPIPPATGTLAWSFTFDDLFVGTYRVTAPAIPGYTLLTPPQDITLALIGSTPLQPFEYQLATAPVQFDLGAGVYPTLDPDPAYQGDKPGVGGTPSVTLTSPTGTVYDDFTMDQTVPGNVLVIDGVVPESGDFRLQFDDALHEPFDESFPLPLSIGGNGRRDVAVTAPAADRVRLFGTAQQRFGPDADDVTALQTGATLTLTDADPATAPALPTYTLTPGTAPDAGTRLDDVDYVIDAVPGTYDLALSQTDYTTTTLVDLGLTTAGAEVERNVEISRLAVVRVQATTSLTAVPGLTVGLSTTSGTAMTPTTPGGNTFVVPAAQYYATATAPGYPTQNTSATPATVEIGQGTTTSPRVISIPLPRYVILDIDGPAEATVAIGSTSIGPQSTSSLFQFTPPQIAATGTLNATITATGYRTRTVPIPADTLYRPATPIVLEPNLTVTGTIAGATPGTAITANRTGGGTASGTISDADGAGPNPSTYSFSGLGAGTWTVSYTELGVGATPTGGVQIIQITATSPTGATASGAAINLTARTATYDFLTVVENSSPPPATVGLGNVAVRIEGSAGTLDSGTTRNNPAAERGELQLSIAENSAPVRWVASATGYMTRAGAITVSALTNTVPTIQMYPTVTGGVVDGDGPVATATVVLCPPGSSATVICDASARLPGISTSGATWTVSEPLVAGQTYRLWATSGTDQGTATIQLNANGRPTYPANITVS